MLGWSCVQSLCFFFEAGPTSPSVPLLPLRPTSVSSSSCTLLFPSSQAGFLSTSPLHPVGPPPCEAARLAATLCARPAPPAVHLLWGGIACERRAASRRKKSAGRVMEKLCPLQMLLHLNVNIVSGTLGQDCRAELQHENGMQLCSSAVVRTCRTPEMQVVLVAAPAAFRFISIVTLIMQIMKDEETNQHPSVWKRSSSFLR